MRRAVYLLAFLVVVPAARAQPPSGIVTAPSGAGLYAANCASCHGSRGEGIQPPGLPGAGGIIGMGPSLRNVGAGTADFYLRTGYMPLDRPDQQPWRRRVLFDARQLRALVRYVASFGHGPPIPQPHPERGSVSKGMQLFTEHCAGCHQIVARGGISTGARVPSLIKANAVEVAEAVRTGPYVMPEFSPRAISNRQLDSIIRYVQFTQAPARPGGWGIGFIGPLPEGMVAWLIGAAALVAACVMFGNRRSAEE